MVSGGGRSWGSDQEPLRVADTRDGTKALARNLKAWLPVRETFSEALMAQLEPEQYLWHEARFYF